MNQGTYSFFDCCCMENVIFDCDIQELRAAASNIEPKHEKEIAALVNSYKTSYPKWVFELRHALNLSHLWLYLLFHRKLQLLWFDLLVAMSQMWVWSFNVRIWI